MAAAPKLGSLTSPKHADANKSVMDSLNKKQEETLTRLSNHKPKAETKAEYLGAMMENIPKETSTDLFQTFNQYEDKIAREIDLELQEIKPKVKVVWSNRGPA